MKKGIFESQETYEKRLEKEEIEAMTGVRQGMWESHDKYKERAKRQYIYDQGKQVGLTQGFWESDEQYENRIKATVREKSTGIPMRWGESYKSYLERSKNRVLQESIHPNPFSPFAPSDTKCWENREKNEEIARDIYRSEWRHSFESEAEFRQRVRIKKLRGIVGDGFRQGLFESQDDYERRLKLEALKINPGLVEWYRL